MFKVKLINSIAPAGLALMPAERYQTGPEVDEPDALLVRSRDLHGLELPASLAAIARAGIGVNNIPVEECTRRGIVVFNTPGANANSVKELVVAGMLLASRDILSGVSWARSLAGNGGEVPGLVEKGKARFAGPELRGKRLGVIGLGAIGVSVANSAAALGMEVTGFDPFITVEAAWGLSRQVDRAPSLEALAATADYLSIHVPLLDTTRGMIDARLFAKMKRGARLLNFARGSLVNRQDLLQALDDGIVSVYVTDFPDEALIAHERVLPIPHLGASTPEAEENCAAMAARQLVDFLERGNIRNSVNFPLCELAMSGVQRLLVANHNVPNMLSRITGLLAESELNIAEMLNKHLDGLAYNIIDLDGKINSETLGRLREVAGVIMVRVV